MIIHRVTATTHVGQTEKLVELMKTEARDLFQVSRISTYANPDESESRIVIFDLDFDDMAEFEAWRAAIPNNQDFFDRWGSLVESYTGQTLHTDG